MPEEPHVNDDRLTQAYGQLLTVRAMNDAPPPVSLDVVRELAEGGRRGSEHEETLDLVLAHPITRAEFHLLRDIAAREPRAAGRHVPTWMAMAAVLVIAVALPLVWPESGIDSPGPMRGEGAFEVVTPAPDESLASGGRVIWRSVSEAASYSVELIDENGASRWRQTTADTSVVLPDSVRLANGGRYTLSVTARLNDGTTERSLPRATSGRAGGG
jgi:hypothetical protein